MIEGKGQRYLSQEAPYKPLFPFVHNRGGVPYIPIIFFLIVGGGVNRKQVLGVGYWRREASMGLERTQRTTEVYLVLMEYDPQYERLKADRTTAELESYVSNKHDMLLQRTLEPGSYKKRFSWLIIDGFAAEMTADQAEILRSAKGVRVIEKDKELRSA